jgi:hypothetical protein
MNLLNFEVMRIGRDGVWVNPEVPVDEAARVVLNLISENVKAMVANAVKDERWACAKTCEEAGTDENGNVHLVAWECAAAIRARGEK